MQFFFTVDQQIGFDEIPPLWAEWLKEIPCIIAEGRESEEVESRLFPSPEHENEERLSDWKAHVQPDLHQCFLSASSLVSEDVKNLKKIDDYFSLSFPGAHAGGWLNALNQARIILAEIHSLKERDINEVLSVFESPQRTIAILKMDFYASIQYDLVEFLEENMPASS
ncbi:MAG: hypothetical protein ABI443_13015 [Chthoniobacterales bacterium]